MTLKERTDVIILNKEASEKLNPLCDLNFSLLLLFLSHTFFLIAIEIFIKFWFLHITNFLTTTEDKVRHEGISDVVLDN